MLPKDLSILSFALPEDIERAKWAGDFDRARRMIDCRLKSPRTPELLKKRLSAELEVLDRLGDDFTYPLDEALCLVQHDIPDFTREELETIMDEGRLEWIYKEGKPYLATRFYETLKDTDPSIRRRIKAHQQPAEETVQTPSGVPEFRNEDIKQVMKNGREARRIRIRTSLQLKDENFHPGKFRVHLPIPKPQINMTDISILSTFPQAGTACTITVAPETAPARTVCFEENMTENHRFEVVYEYTSVIEYHDLSEALEKGHSAASSRPAESPEFSGYNLDDLSELPPHIRFTSTIRMLAEQLKGSETDPLRIARAFYDYCTKNVVYSYMRSYFTMEEIPEYCAAGLKGDCGVQALTFITLCRCAGIPARWQSGLYVAPHKPNPDGSSSASTSSTSTSSATEETVETAGISGLHDWAMFYVEPYGWLFADPSFGGSAYRAGNLEKWNYYFGNLDVNRMAANSAFQAELCPPKRFTRTDPYDNQQGEFETENRGFLWDDLIIERDVLRHDPV